MKFEGCRMTFWTIRTFKRFFIFSEPFSKLLSAFSYKQHMLFFMFWIPNFSLVLSSVLFPFFWIFNWHDCIVS